LFLRLAVFGEGPRPRVINVDGHPAYASAVAELKQTGELGRRSRCRTAPYLNKIIEQDHRFIKKRITASLDFRSVEGARRTIEGYEAMHAIRKGQVRWVARGTLSRSANSFIRSSASLHCTDRERTGRPFRFAYVQQNPKKLENLDKI
jgi:transposase-like protein